MKKLLRGIGTQIIRQYAIRENVSTHKDLHIGLGTIMWAPRSLTVGPRVYIGKNCTIECDGSIGRGVLIANLVGIVGRRDHDMRAVGHLIRDAPWAGENLALATTVEIQDDVWIGYGAIVLAPAVIGRGAVVGAGAVVTGDIPEYAIVAGNPATVIGSRFNEVQRAEHEKRLG
jgi:acetyltransferase-like isoleucine patch superfamily enzyme